MTGSFSEGIDLAVANSKLEGSRCGWQRFPGLLYKLKVPAASFLLFENGKFVCTGIKTREKGKEAMSALLVLLKERGLVSDVCVFECCVKNLVASVAVGGSSVDLGQFASRFDAIYEPEKFPAAIHKMDGSNATFLVFLSGTMICSGVADETVLKQIVDDFCAQLIEKEVLEHTFL